MHDARTNHSNYFVLMQASVDHSPLGIPEIITIADKHITEIIPMSLESVPVIRKSEFRNFRKSKILAKFQDFRENPISQKCKIFAKIQNFRENPKFSQKSKIFIKIQNFRKNPKFLQKI